MISYLAEQNISFTYFILSNQLESDSEWAKT